MKTSTVIKNLLAGACVYYAISSLLLLLISVLIKGSLNDVAVAVLRVLLLFPFGLALSGGGMLLKSQALSKGWRLFLHYLITLAACFFFLLLPIGTNQGAPYFLIALLLISLVYWLGYLIIAVTKKRFRSFREE